MSSNRNTLRKLNHYKLVNHCETLEELSDAIIEIAKDNNGWINGKQESYSAEKMAENCLNLSNNSFNLLTDNYGIRQQAIYILYCNGELDSIETKSNIENVTIGDLMDFIKHML